MYTINNQIAADRIIRYETLAEGMKDMLAAIGIDWDGWLPHAKSGTGKSAVQKGDYRSHYDEETSALVAELYAPEIAAHGYTF
ncbi:MAG: hypothetical protein H5U24_01945 [Thioclava marina]|uniref:hypothetical protein n=1 Tax=Thioclava marina TaxID=1915077 RepID=UPI00198D2E95|nr:hypothetical protein [Thioclava marina]MBC7144147.1 hypothetical protein [Thioclava marina]